MIFFFHSYLTFFCQFPGIPRPPDAARHGRLNLSPIPKLDRYIVIHVATTCDEHGVYVTKDSAEVIELGWILLDTKNCDEVRPSIEPLNGLGFFLPANRSRFTHTAASRSILVKPVNTPITPLCSKFCVSMALRWVDITRRKK